MQQQRKAPSAFDDMFSFESQIEKHLPPQVLEQANREALAGEYGHADKWLSQPEQRGAFRKLSPVDQLRATFAGCDDYAGSELEAMVEHMREVKQKPMRYRR